MLKFTEPWKTLKIQKQFPEIGTHLKARCQITLKSYTYSSSRNWHKKRNIRHCTVLGIQATKIHVLIVNRFLKRTSNKMGND